MVAIICSSPFHVFTAIALKYTKYKDRDVELILLDYFKNSEETYEKINNSGMFKCVYYVHGKKELKKYHVDNNRLFMMWYLYNSDSYLASYGIDSTDIKELLYPYYEPLAILIAKSIFKHCINCKFVFYDDGTGSYLTDFDKVVPPRIELLFRVPLRFYIPNLVLSFSKSEFGRNESVVHEKIQIPVVPEFKSKVNLIFDYLDDNLNYKYIFLDQYGELYDEATKLISLIHSNIILELIDKKMVIKKHPKRTDTVYEDSDLETIRNNSNIPYEITILNDPNIENKCLISDYSTACFTPKLIFDKEPKVVFLYKILHKDSSKSEIKRIDNLFLQLKKLYKNKHNVMAPLTLEELANCLRNI